MSIETNPPSATEPSTLLERFEAILDAHVRPGLEADGGGIELVSIDEDKIAQVRLLGACQGCSSSVYTLTMGVEAAVKQHLPEIRFVEAVP
ncbi:NifU family protein [Isosphaeraceae bacterium EP7]